jgi:hypothetical protein
VPVALGVLVKVFTVIVLAENVMVEEPGSVIAYDAFACPVTEKAAAAIPVALPGTTPPVKERVGLADPGSTTVPSDTPATICPKFRSAVFATETAVTRVAVAEEVALVAAGADRDTIPAATRARREIRRFKERPLSRP